MLAKLSVSNYAIINNLTVEFSSGLNTVTGETGAGKSILLGALGLILGNRADLSVLKEKDVKCVVEGFFEVGNYNIKAFFSDNDLDYDKTTILRREITPAGKSRAFINDTPVNLKTLRELGLHLIDIHSQHQNLELGNQKFQLDLIDSVANTLSLLKEYKSIFITFVQRKKELEERSKIAEKAKADLDYFQFQFNQLDEAKFQKNEVVELEQELEQLTHSQDIKSALLEVQNLLDNEQFSVIRNIKESLRIIENIQTYILEAPGLAERLQSSLFELKDILEETESLSEKVEHNPLRIEKINTRLNILYSLLQKHNAKDVEELIEIRDDFDAKINTVVGYDDELEKLRKLLKQTNTELEKKGLELSNLRKKSFAKIEKSVKADLTQLGMPKAKFDVEQKDLQEYTSSGKDAVSFLFSANPDSVSDEISKIASGGEMSRLMLAIKNLLRNSKVLPTVIFDEIDAGVSGEIAVKMGNIIKSFSATTQIINITHLPQVAAKGDSHFMVYKFEENNKTYTSIKKLNDEERIKELAKMVGGEHFTASNLQSAQELLNN